MGNLSLPSPGDLPNPGIKPRSPALGAASLPAEPQGKRKNIGVGSLSLLQGIFLTQETNRDLLYCRRILYQLSYEGSPYGDRHVDQSNRIESPLWAPKNEVGISSAESGALCRRRGGSRQSCCRLNPEASRAEAAPARRQRGSGKGGRRVPAAPAGPTAGEAEGRAPLPRPAALGVVRHRAAPAARKGSEGLEAARAVLWGPQARIAPFSASVRDRSVGGGLSKEASGASSRG